MGGAGAGVSLLSPELTERVERIAAAQSKSAAEVIGDAVLEYWVRYAARAKLKPGQW